MQLRDVFFVNDREEAQNSSRSQLKVFVTIKPETAAWKAEVEEDDFSVFSVK
jgi:hypothetical protein